MESSITTHTAIDSVNIQQDSMNIQPDSMNKQLDSVNIQLESVIIHLTLTLTCYIHKLKYKAAFHSD